MRDSIKAFGVGLAIGLVLVILLGLYVQHEVSRQLNDKLIELRKGG